MERKKTRLIALQAAKNLNKNPLEDIARIRNGIKNMFDVIREDTLAELRDSVSGD